MTRKSPFDWPPGPARRDEMRRQGYNISPLDFTDEELAAIAAETAAEIAAEARGEYEWHPAPGTRNVG